MQAAIRASLVLALLSFPLAAQAHTLEVRLASGEAIYAHPVAEGGRWCVVWNHSVAGFPVRDCYRAVDGRMMLERSHQPDFAAGLGHIPGRGEMISAPEGGYWIENIDAFVPGNCYRLRVGAMGVNHRIVLDDVEASLSAAAARQSVRVILRPDGHEGGIAC